MNDYLAAILFFLPAGVANMTPVIINKIPGLNRWQAPMDFGLKWHDKRIFGANKRWRGLIFGTLAAGVTAKLVAIVAPNAVVSKHTFLLGCLLGFGALLGDAVESFFKRWNGIPPGHSLLVFDQTDYIIGALVLTYPFVRLPFWAIVTIFFVYFGLHLITVYLAYLAGIRHKPI
ncbi:MAG: CDP-archaeol synthase [Patescibacteria group bacterium]